MKRTLLHWLVRGLLWLLNKALANEPHPPGVAPITRAPIGARHWKNGRPDAPKKDLQ